MKIAFHSHHIKILAVSVVILDMRHERRYNPLEVNIILIALRGVQSQYCRIMPFHRDDLWSDVGTCVF